MAPKVSAAARLEATVCGGLNPLAAAVMFSSIAALLGSAGQAGSPAHWFQFQLDLRHFVPKPLLKSSQRNQRRASAS